MQSFKDELNYLRNEDLAKTCIIKSLTEIYCVPANIYSVVFPANLHHENVQVEKHKFEKHKSSTNKSCDSPKTDTTSINLPETKSKVNQKNNQDLRSNNPQKKRYSYLVILL